MCNLDEDAAVIVQFKALTFKEALIKSDCHQQERPSVAFCLLNFLL